MRKVGIIGIGPRGGYSLERFIIELAEQNSLSEIHISLFEATGNFGNGQVYDTSQNLSNWINITERILELDERQAIKSNFIEIESFPSYHSWVHKDFNSLPKVEKDTYPPRAQIGAYLLARFQSLIEPLLQDNMVTLYDEKANELQWVDNTLQITTNENSYQGFDEILLTIGHQTTELSEQVMEWEKFATNKQGVDLFKSPYPVNTYLQHENLNWNSTIGIRGFGLAMIDVVRAVSEKFGSYTINNDTSRCCSYKSEKEVKNMFVPFSLDGLPPVPKPLNAQIDAPFKPSGSSIAAFEKQLENKQIQKEAESPKFLIEAFAPIASGIFTNLPKNNKTRHITRQEIEKLIMRWLKDQSLEHFLFTPVKQPADKSMRDYVEMAIGRGEVSLDYCVGQVWRHCQPTIYKALSFNECSDKVFSEIIGLDESTKRYSYGPPVESIQQLLALTEAGILNLDLVYDPTIELSDSGWQIYGSGDPVTATFMIDSVLDAPKIKAVSSPLVTNMLEDDLLKVVHDDLGVTTDEYGYLISRQEEKVPIALLGRLAKGTVIGVDAILECFGPRPRQWARRAASNHVAWLNKK